MEVSTGSVTALIGCAAATVAAAAFTQRSAPDMKVNDHVATERQLMCWRFALAGGVLLLMAVVVALSFGRMMRTAGRWAKQGATR